MHKSMNEVASTMEVVVVNVNVLCLQTRAKLNTYGGGGPMAEVTAGGNALKFYASVRLQVRRKEQLKRGDVVLLMATNLD